MADCPDCGADLAPHCLNPQCDALRCPNCHGWGSPDRGIWASAPDKEHH